MSNQGETPLTRSGKIITGVGVAVVAAVIAVVGIGIGTAAHAAQVRADAEHAMAAAAPAYKGTIELGGTLDDLNAQSAQAKQAYDAEQVRLATEAARVAAELQRQQEAAAEAQRQAAADEAARPSAQSNISDGDSSGPVKCPTGTHANAVDADGNESACEADGPNGEQCQAYDANNNCTNWYKP